MEPAFPFFVGTEAAVRTKLFRVFFVQQGALRIQTESRVMTLSAGTLLLVPPGRYCRLVKGQDAAVRTFAFSRSLVDPLTLEPSVNLMVEAMSESEPQASRLSPTELEQADFLFSSLAKEVQQKGTGYQTMVRLKLMEVLLLLSRGRCGGEGADLRAPVRFHPEEAMQHIRERCADPLSLSEIASRYELNPSYFSRLFHRHAGIPLVEFINRARIQKSCRLLKRSDASIVEIAVAVGYNNLSHFNRCFRRLMGVSPREYRTKTRK